MSTQARRLAAIVAADVVGYSLLMGKDEIGTLAALKALRSGVIDPRVSARGGRVFKSMGDGLLMEFTSVVDAVHCVVDLQRAMAAHDPDTPPERRIVLRIAVNLDDVIVEDGDVFGEGVNIVARLQVLARPGGVCLAHRVHEEVCDRLGVTFDDGGEQTLKNIARPVRVWHWSPAPPHQGGGVDADEAARALAGKPSIAVLPFLNLSRDPEQDYFADGVAEDIIAALSRFHELVVLARSSSFAFKESALGSAAIARQLGAQYVLSGSLRKAGGRIRLSVELTSAESGAQVWSDRYDRELIDVFELQDDISRSVAAVVHPAIRSAEIERARRKPLTNLTGYDLYLRALPHIWAGTREGVIAAVDLLRQSLAHDESSATSHAMLGWCLFNAPSLGGPADGLDEALVLTRRAVGIDPTDAFAQAAYGQQLAWIAGDCAQGFLHADEAVRLNPSSAFAWCARAFVAYQAGEFEQAADCFVMAIRLSPDDVFAYLWLTFSSAAHFALERYDDGVSLARRAIQRNPDYGTAHRLLAANLALGGHTDEACEATRRRDLTQRTSLAEIKALRLFRQEDMMQRYLAAQRACGVPD